MARKKRNKIRFSFKRGAFKKKKKSGAGWFSQSLLKILKISSIAGFVVGIGILLYYADKNGSFKQEKDNLPQKLQTKQLNNDKLIIVASRSHFNDNIGDFRNSLDSTKELGNFDVLRDSMVNNNICWTSSCLQTLRLFRKALSDLVSRYHRWKTL